MAGRLAQLVNAATARRLSKLPPRDLEMATEIARMQGAKHGRSQVNYVTGTTAICSALAAEQMTALPRS